MCMYVGLGIWGLGDWGEGWMVGWEMGWVGGEVGSRVVKCAYVGGGIDYGAQVWHRFLLKLR